MDTSETYIKMCEKAEEIQLANQEFKTNKNIHQSSVMNGVCIVMGDFFYLPEIYTQWFDKDAVWLPRQDQLQAMIIETKQTTLLSPLEKLLLNVDEFTNPANYCTHGEREAGMYHQGYCEICFNQRDKVFSQFTSMEQLWLAFVMKVKYQKVWSGTDWIKGQ